MAEVAEKKNSITRGRKKQRIANNDDGRRGWSDLPKELVELFMRRLLYIDQIYLRATCKSWHTVGSLPTLSGSQKNHMPWLLGIDYNSSWSSCKLSDPAYRKTYTIDMSPLRIRVSQSRVHVHESKSGWLLLSSSSAIGRHYFIMYSPFLTSNNLLELPVLTTKKLIFGAFSHSNKYDDSSSYHDGFSFVALSYVSGSCSHLQISTCKWGDDAWTTTPKIHCPFLLFRITWLYSQGLFYYATMFGEVGTLSVDRLEWSTLPCLDRLLSKKKDEDDRMMITDQGELYLFTVHQSEWSGWAPIYTKVHRLNLRSEAQTTTTWELLESLGQDQALFVDGCKLSAKLISKAPKEVANQVYYCSGKFALKTEFNSGRKTSGRSYPCSQRYGSFSKEMKYKKLWVEPPDIHCIPALCTDQPNSIINKA